MCIDNNVSVYDSVLFYFYFLIIQLHDNILLFVYKVVYKNCIQKLYT